MKSVPDGGNTPHIVFEPFLLLPHLHLELGDSTLGGILYRIAEPAAPTTSGL
jgi:hypothetical protein